MRAGVVESRPSQSMSIPSKEYVRAKEIAEATKLALVNMN
jgi:hypothetical protein